MYRLILFDVDGVFLSEERCFDVSALAVWEMLHAEHFLGLRSGRHEPRPAEERIKAVRNEVFQGDRVLDWMKKRGVNSNWDMVFLAFSVQLMLLFRRLFPQKEKEVRRLLEEAVTEEGLRRLREWGGEDFSTFRPDFSVFFSLFEGRENMERDELMDHFNRLAEEWFGVNTAQFSRNGSLWKLGHSVFQEWYLGDDLYRRVEGKEPRIPGKQGFLHRETPLAPPERIREMLLKFREQGIRLGIGTGRTELETRVPLKALGLWELFDPEHVATATDVLAAEEAFPDRAPLGKPDPYTYVKAYLGKEAAIREALDFSLPVPDGGKVLIVGDSVADLIAARKMGCVFAATLTGLTGEEARRQFEEMGADQIIRDVTGLEPLLE